MSNKMVPLISIALPALVLYGISKALFSSKKLIDLKKKVVVITGASSGLGKACAKLFAKEGAKVVLCARNKSTLQKVKEEILTLLPISELEEPVVVQLDLADPNSIAEGLKNIMDQVERVDVLINNGGISYRGSILETDLQTHKRVMDVNYFGSVALTTALLPIMIKQQSGHIVNVSSVQGKISIPYRSAYSSSKHACQAFYDCLRAEVADQNIHVTVMSPGYIKTNLSLNALNADGSQYGVLDKTTESGMSPESVAQRLLQAVEYGEKDVILADTAARLCVYFRNLLPNLFCYIMKKRAQSKPLKSKTS